MRQKFSEISASQRYHLMTQVVIPRPIAWVLTANESENSTRCEQSYNLAPYSYFNAISSDPPLVMMSIGKKPDGTEKDTRINCLQQKQMVIHIPSVDDMQAVSGSAESFDHGVSEVDALGLALSEEPGWPLPRLRECGVAMLCTLYDVTEIGPNKQAIVFCEIQDLYLDDALTTQDEKGRLAISAEAINPLARLGANQYAAIGKPLTLARPK